MIYYEKTGHWPFLKAKKKAIADDLEADYSPDSGVLAVHADNEKGVAEPTIQPVRPAHVIEE